MLVSFDDRPRNLIADGFDLGLRIGWLEGSALKARKLLPDWKTPSPGLYALWSANATHNALSRRFVDFLAENALPRRRNPVTGALSR